MRERIRRYIPSFRQRTIPSSSSSLSPSITKKDGLTRNGSPATDEDGDGDNGGDERDMETALARVRQLESRAVTAQRLRRRNINTNKMILAKRQETNTLPVIVSEIVDGNRPAGVAGATVTVSIGLSLQITTVSLEGGSTFVSVSSSWFTFDATGGISSAPEPTSTSEISTTTTTSGESPEETTTLTTSDSSLSSLEAITTSLSLEPTTTTTDLPTPSSPLTVFTTSPTPTSVGSAALDEATISLGDAPAFYPTTLSPSLISSRNMTAHGLLQTQTTIRKTSTSLETSTKSRSSSSSSFSSSSSSSYSSTRISTSIEVAVSTIYPADSEPTTPLDSPATSVEASPDAGSGSTTTNKTSSENLPPILGGVFGGLAGIGLVLWALLFLLRKRRRTSERAVGILGPGTRGGHHRAISAETGAGSVGEMSQARTSLVPSFLAAGGLFGRSSADTAAAAVEPAERGFVKISGRKLPSMYGGDDMVPASIAVANARASVSETGSRNVSGGTHHPGGSFYQDDDILHAPTPSPFHPGAARTAMRSGSPAHVSRISEDEPAPVQTRRPPPPPPATHINDPGEGSSRYPTPPPGAVRRMHSLIGPDGVGRSLASQDGSKTSRFTEDV
ncbi:hypothetical protein TWF481_010021 [Arthrobotrys musiformis]|uniref:Mid2 domain-containing protein n=1 Tax=Arthrobotrys musiformis TaxID=47236 RepID=A0AAV9W1Y9_9PEZI